MSRAGTRRAAFFWRGRYLVSAVGTMMLRSEQVAPVGRAEGPWETWFYRRQNKFQMRTAKRRLADALELETEIRELMKPVS